MVFHVGTNISQVSIKNMAFNPMMKARFYFKE